MSNYYDKNNDNNLIGNCLKNIRDIVFFAGDKQTEGTYVCKNCGKKVYLENGKVLPNCPRCYNKIFYRQ